MKVHFIPKPDNSGYVMFFCDSLRFFNVNAKTKEMVEAIIGNMPRLETMRKYGLSEAMYEKIIIFLEENLKERALMSYPMDKVEKLTLHVSNTCNLACAYCYANGGSYHSTEGLMTIEVAQKAIDLFSERYHVIETIVFFGGEPLLNIETIEFVCQYCMTKYQNGILHKLPLFAVVSNGTVFSDKIVSLINKYNIKLTISIDGPAEINDLLRRFKSGAPSSRIVINNIKKYKEKTNKPDAIEATFTEKHIREGFSPYKVAQYIQDELKVNNIIMMPVCVGEDSEFYVSDYEVYLKSIDEFFEQHRQGSNSKYTHILTILDRLLVKGDLYPSCNAAVRNFAVSSKGNVYPCHIFMDRREFCMGSIYEDVFNNNRFKEISKSFVAHSWPDECKECFARRVCVACPGAKLYLTGNPFVLNAHECLRQKKTIERVLINLAKH